MKAKLSFLVPLLLCTSQALAAVNINTASQAELETVNGIGPNRAKAIVDDRKANGPYRKVDDLTRIQGIGSKNIASLRPHLTVGKGEAGVAPDKKAPTANGGTAVRR